MHGGAPESGGNLPAVRRRITGKRPWFDTLAEYGELPPGEYWSPLPTGGQAADKRPGGAKIARVLSAGVSFLATGEARRPRGTRATVGPRRRRAGPREEPGHAEDTEDSAYSDGDAVSSIAISLEDMSLYDLAAAVHDVGSGDEPLDSDDAGEANAAADDESAQRGAVLLDSAEDTQDSAYSDGDAASSIAISLEDVSLYDLAAARHGVEFGNELLESDDAGEADAAAEDESAHSTAEGDADDRGNPDSEANSDGSTFGSLTLTMTRKVSREEREAWMSMKRGPHPQDLTIEKDHAKTKLPLPGRRAEKNFLIHEQDDHPVEELRSFADVEEAKDEGPSGSSLPARTGSRSPEDRGPTRATTKQGARAGGEVSTNPASEGDDEGRPSDVESADEPGAAVLKRPAARRRPASASAGSGPVIMKRPASRSKAPGQTIMKRPAARAKAPPTRAAMKRPARADVQPSDEEVAADGDDEGGAEEPAAAVLRKPAGRRGCAAEFCKGPTCVFSLSNKGAPARTQKPGHCMFCCKDEMARQLEVRGGRYVTRDLRKLRSLDETIFEKAAARVRELGGASVVARALERTKQSAPPKPLREKWDALLAQRTAVRGPLREPEAEAYEKQRLRDRAWVRRKFFSEDHAARGPITQEAEDAEKHWMPGECGDIAINDTGLPAASRSELATRAELWCKYGSWTMCSKCHSMSTREFRPHDLQPRDTIPTTKSCSVCKRNIKVPSPNAVPEELKGLSPVVVRALRPLDVDTGREQRSIAGYRVHDAMMKFQWSEISVKSKIKLLEDDSDRAAAKKAFRYLKECKESSYRSFLDRHNSFLAKHDHKKLPKNQRFLSLSYLEQPGIECCLWPHLYWTRAMCETVVRTSEAEPTKSKTKRGMGKRKDHSSGESNPDDASDDNGGERGTAHYIKHSFMIKVLSPVVGYSSDYELLHFVYDLHMWTTLGAKKNLGKQFGVDFRLMLKLCSFSPEYWRTQHDALIDMQRQCGYPRVFRTRAPYEKSFPYHAWVLDEMRKEGRGRQHLAGPETLHMAHVLRQLDAGLFSGANNRQVLDARGWTKHIFGATDGTTPTVLNFASRLEFQDGKRKPGTQKYHGRGTTHSHTLDFLTNVEAIDLPSKISASLPPESEPLTRALVKGCQPDDRRASTRPIREEATAYDPKTKGLLLHYTKEDQELNVRAYVKDTIEVTKCHEDAQVEEGRGNVMRYVASYDAKFSGSFATEWQCNEPSAYSVARRILFDYHPLEPEMWLTIAGRLFPQMTTGGKIKILSIPWVTKEQKPAHVTNYEQCRWRREDMTLLEWLRKTNKDGAIDRWVKLRYRQDVFVKCHDAHVRAGNEVSLKAFCEAKQAAFKKYVASCGKDDEDEDVSNAEEVMNVEQWLQKSEKLKGPEESPEMYSSLEAFANAIKCRGEKLIAATPYSMLSDRYYGQWLTLNVPFRNMGDFCVREVTERVPERYVNFALALHHRREDWSSPEKIEEEMKLHAHRDAHIASVKDKVRAHAHTVGRYLSGELDKDIDVPSEDEDGPSPEGIVHRTHAQRRLQRSIDVALHRAISIREAEGEDQERLAQEAWDDGGNKIIAAIGAPGTGKTAIVHKCVTRWSKGKHRARILFALPTGQLAARMRQRHPDVDVDTCHGGLLLYKSEAESLPIMTQYDAVFIDELSMITEEHFGRIVAMWKGAGKIPALVLMGDFWQLPGPFKTPQKLNETEEWAEHVLQLGFTVSVRCKDEVLLRKIKALRHSIPDKKMFERICRGHRAWRTQEPTGRDIAALFAKVAQQTGADGKPRQTTIVTCTRRAAAMASELAVSVLFANRNQPTLGEADLTWESNMDNYDEEGALKSKGLKPKTQKLYKGMRVFLTKNMDKREDFVNGMGAVVEHFDKKAQCLEVVTDTNKRLSIHLYTEYVEGGRGKVTSFPVRVGYATTIHKVQGATLELWGPGPYKREWSIAERGG